MKVTAVVPARDEADRIAATVTALASFTDRVIVVDDGSSDGTAERAVDAGADVVTITGGVGKGGALERGLDRADMSQDVVLLADADLGDSAAALAALLAPVVADEVDLAIAVLPRQGGGFGSVKRFAGWAIGRLGGIRVQEPLSGQRAIRGRDLDHLRPLAAGFGVETAMTIDAARRGLRIREIPVESFHRRTGRDLAGFRHRGRQGWDILLAVIRRARRRR